MGIRKLTRGPFGPRVIGAGVAAVLAAVFIIAPVSAAPKHPKASTVNVEMDSQITGSSFGSPETVATAKTVVKRINATGGLGGHPIKLTTCNDKEDPTDAGNC